MIQNDYQYEILTDKFFEWHIYDRNCFNESLICSSHFKIKNYIW